MEMVIQFTPRQLYPRGRDLPVPTEQEAQWTPTAGLDFFDQNLFPLLGIKTLGSTAVHPVD